MFLEQIKLFRNRLITKKLLDKNNIYQTSLYDYLNKFEERDDAGLVGIITDNQTVNYMNSGNVNDMLAYGNLGILNGIAGLVYGIDVTGVSDVKQVIRNEAIIIYATGTDILPKRQIEFSFPFKRGRITSRQAEMLLYNLEQIKKYNQEQSSNTNVIDKIIVHIGTRNKKYSVDELISKLDMFVANKHTYKYEENIIGTTYEQISNSNSFSKKIKKF